MSEIVWPSSRKKARLRKEGIVPLSPLSLRLLVLLTTGIVLSVRFEAILDILSYERLLALSSLTEIKSVTHLLMDELAQVLMILFTAVVVVLLVCGLLQTRFLFLPGLCSINISRLWRWPNPGSFAGRVVQVLISLLLVLPLAIGISYWCTAIIASAFVQSAAEIFDFSSYKLSTPVISTSLIGLAVLFAVGLQQLKFLWVNRMSREELEKEARER